MLGTVGNPRVFLFVYRTAVFPCYGIADAGAVCTIGSMADETGPIRLLIRGDDIGSFHSANAACIHSYINGIMRSVELMVPCPWFEEACFLLNEHPGLDVGIHLTLTAEWESVKWRPLTHAPSLVDDAGFFFPMIHSSDNYPESRALKHQNWQLDEIEAEFRAQIDLGLRRVSHASHVSCHMGCSSWNDSVREVYEGLAREYNLDIDPQKRGVERCVGYREAESYEDREVTFIETLMELEPGTYLFVDHPAFDTDEMRSVFHHGYEDVARDRDSCTRVFSSEQVKNAIRDQGIELISYRDL